MDNIETKPTPFYSQKQDDKYSLLGRSIGVDTQTEYFTTRTIESSNLIPGDLNGQRLNFNFTVSPSAYIDWNNCNMEIGFVFINFKFEYSIFTYFTNYKANMEEELIDKYEAWEEKLEEREKQLEQ